MTSASKIGIGAIITFLGLAGVVYSMPIVTHAAASKGPVFKETDVPKYPDGMWSYIPLEFGSIGALIAGISITAFGFASTPSAAGQHTAKTDRKTGFADAA
jgi:hypothetical protein